ncbi:2-hydroxyhepta-2,4-diene-1,7-dioate isomerase [Aspergillus heteromorphus CBS 117.55]|uniref:Fumarylacetoacetase n=1 Tax=Aspergillus heteromorphus CBS 117.55 TaxID=1448321 RepID=A0A317WIT7_9EURO|nr:2-hydroxyhepta-2,4-diene-1,7-dioate isomerase [Aspergillus heteromorphus CBS 117.55]PWY85965.1 2-hydroxyhepta-2,4-diene-1,7-dioate isomerase [Aspergillus heteromorphus CBS 117.55]
MTVTETPFTIDNLPYGVVSTADNPTPRCATALEDDAIDLSALERVGYFKSIPGFKGRVFSSPTLNTFASLPKETHVYTRAALTDLLSDDEIRKTYAIPLSRVQNHLPMETKNFSDFYCSYEHTRNYSELYSLTIPRSWWCIPSVYNGRQSSLRISGTPIRRPWGVVADSQNPEGLPVFKPSARFDFELEMGVYLSRPYPPGEILDIADAKDYIFGLVILNDWSARDIQTFEMTPLGPFHGKGSGTSISPWIVTMEALEGSRCEAKPQSPAPLRHLAWKGEAGEATFDIELKARVIRNKKSYTVTETNLKELYWTPIQQLTHLCSAGEGLSAGDIFGTGTVTSDRINEQGEEIGVACLIERGLERNVLSEARKDGLVFLDDGDEVVMEGWCVNRLTGGRFGFGECRGVVIPALMEGEWEGE